MVICADLWVESITKLFFTAGALHSSAKKCSALYALTPLSARRDGLLISSGRLAQLRTAVPVNEVDRPSIQKETR